jgi:hypothetical protein
MAGNRQQDLLNALRLELKVLELGGYHPSVREPHKELFHEREEQIMGGDQKVLVARMEGLKKPDPLARGPLRTASSDQCRGLGVHRHDVRVTVRRRLGRSRFRNGLQSTLHARVRDQEL